MDKRTSRRTDQPTQQKDERVKEVDQAAWDEASKHLNLASRFPELPFRSGPGYIHAFEFNEIVNGPDFGDAIQSLTDHYEDDAVVVSVDPHPDEVERWPGWIATFIARRGSLPDSYVNGFYPGDPHDIDGPAELSEMATIVGITGTSGNWGAWAEREPWEIGVLFTRDRTGPWLDTPPSFRVPSIPIDSFRAPHDYLRPLPPGAHARYLENIRNLRPLHDDHDTTTN